MFPSFIEFDLHAKFGCLRFSHTVCAPVGGAKNVFGSRDPLGRGRSWRPRNMQLPTCVIAPDFVALFTSTSLGVIRGSPKIGAICMCPAPLLMRRGWPPRNMLICHVSLQKNLVALTLGHRDPQIWPPQIQRRNNQRRCNRRAWWSGNPTIRTNPFPWSGLWPKQILPQLLASSCILTAVDSENSWRSPQDPHTTFWSIFLYIRNYV